MRVLGIDPGLVHTGMVLFHFNTVHGSYYSEHYAVPGYLDEKGKQQVDIVKVADQAKTLHNNMPLNAVFIEAYRARSNFQHDARMSTAVTSLRRLIPNAETLDNTGVTKVVKSELMKLLGVWKFPTVTNHQDLRSAARIALLGMFKDASMNEIIAGIVQSHINGTPWEQL